MGIIWKPESLLKRVARASARRNLTGAQLVHCGGECCVFRYRRGRNNVAVKWCFWDDSSDVESAYISDMKKALKGVAPRGLFAWPIGARPVKVMAKRSHVSVSRSDDVVALRGTIMRAYLCDLHDYIQSGEATAAFLERAMRTVGLALYYMHVAGYAHNDVRLENVLVRRGGVGVALADFGCTAPLHSSTKCKHSATSMVENDRRAFMQMIEELSALKTE